MKPLRFPNVLLIAGVLLTLACGGSVDGRRTLQRGPERNPDERTIDVPGATLTIEMGDVEEDVARRLEAWVRHAAMMVVDYCGEFPVPTLRVQLRTRRGSGVGFGQHFDGRIVRVRVGRDTPESELHRDWVMVHEMLHTALPHLSRRHRWMMEGLSTYLESVLRVRAGVMTEEEMWARWTATMDEGLPPRSVEEGLDGWRSWGAVYWGGALFWLKVDVEIRRRTHGRRSLQDGIRGLLASGGNSRVSWPTSRVVSVIDEVTGTEAASDVYEHMARRPSRMNLDHFFGRLGVAERPGGDVVLIERAPLARVRRGIIAAPP